jgi:hypothetical protein
MYSAKLTGLKPKDVMFLISNMPIHVDMKFVGGPRYDGGQPQPKAKANGRTGVKLDDCIMLGDFAKARNGTKAHQLVQLVMEFEKDHGAGEMRKRVLRDKMKPHSAAPDAVIGAALKAGIIKGA